jgi:aerobic-type carbon monoxide dehydrogenase small subunit (CoxS/CutS family)
VLVDGLAVQSCTTPLWAAKSHRVQTIEGLANDRAAQQLQSIFLAEQAAQCGYCIAGMIMRAQALLERTPSPSDEQIRTHLQPNLCRCGTHMRILRAVRRAAGTGR